MNYIVEEKHNGERIDKFLVGVMENVSRTDVQKLIEAGEVKVGGGKVSKNFRVETGMAVVVEKMIEKESSTLEPEDIPLNIVYEDDDIVVINKPRNLVVHPGNGVSKGTLAAALLYHFKENLSTVNGPLRPGIVQRVRYIAHTMRLYGAARVTSKERLTLRLAVTRRIVSRWLW